MRVLVIGCGFLGSAIVERLESEGHELLIFTRTRNERIKSKQILGDIFKFDEFVAVLNWKPQVVIHTAWITAPNVYRHDVSNLKYSAFTRSLTEALAHSDIEHLIILGTCAEYNAQVQHRSSASPRTSLYAQQKVIAFNSARETMLTSNVRFTWARIFYAYGRFQNPKRLIPSLINSLRSGESIILLDGSSIYDWITSRDIASAISWILNHDLPMEIEIGSSVGVTNLELLATLEELLNVIHNLDIDSSNVSGYGEVFVADKSSSLFNSGWSPQDSLTQGLEWVLSQ